MRATDGREAMKMIVEGDDHAGLFFYARVGASISGYGRTPPRGIHRVVTLNESVVTCVVTIRIRPSDQRRPCEASC